MSSRIISSRIASSAASALVPSSTQAAALVGTRSLSSQGSMAVERLRDALEEYRAVHHARCIPSRFKKDIIKVASIDTQDADRIAVTGMATLIANINMEHKVSHHDLETIFMEIGCPNKKTIPADRLMQIIA